ncbi:tetratricopeptide repeat protein [Ancylomarina sp. 16SWW S1-10-2]|uniref:type IX secretion system periplasmic lipoprotein PorW/SprE n=1 Tax=Ancylomarina sp. 16SWW S1-10-2 TaxID=2499681 RepID=UPI0012AE401F|nr:tetratricopeptide repeat protein [Ancylomarina sp. 16SWW S1-10-2]MRT92436.1 tetratricopeptide repeat protein [Ancylomarina sp. 16SWW S1-10-2]
MNKRRLNIAILILSIVFFSIACSNQKNTFVSRQYHALTTHFNVYFNGKESLKSAKTKIEEGIEYNYNTILPVFDYQDLSARDLAAGDIDNVIDKATKAIKLHSITRKPKRKKVKQSDKYKEFRKKNEFNNWIEDCYLLLGKAQFYKGEYRTAEKALEQGLKDFPKSDKKFKFQIELARCQIDQENYSEATSLLEEVSALPKLSKKTKLEIAALFADINVREKDYQSAISNLQTAIHLQSTKRVKAKYYYILGQLYQKLDQNDNASDAFLSLIKLHSIYEMAFNAKISQALIYSGVENGLVLRKQLNKMLKDQKNVDYRDQIYFALAEMDMIDGDKEAAIENYWNSTQKSVANDNQKAISFIKLADNYFADLNYKKAQLCYDSSMVYLDQNYPNYSKISSRVGNLTELVNNLNIIEREDSLQNVAAMSEKERDFLITSLIDIELEKEENKKLEEAENRADKTFFTQNNMIGNTSSSNTSQTQGNWYFYNPTTVGLGKSEFQRKWGRRKLSDNWRRKNKSIQSGGDIEVEPVDETFDNEAVVEKGDKKSKAYYLADLPLTDDLIDKSNELIMEALHEASFVYSERLNNKAKAVETMETLLSRYPNNPYLLSAYYQCYSLSIQSNNISKSEYYKNKILTEFPDTDYAKAIKDPNYWLKLEMQNNEAESLYLKAYDTFQNFYYEEVISICEQGLEAYPESKIGSNFLLLKALSVGRTQDVDTFKKLLQELIDSKPSSEIEELASGILSTLIAGSVPVRYSRDDMNKARQNRLLINWRIEDQLALEMINGESPEIEKEYFKYVPNEEHYFVLLFKRRAADPNRTLFNIDRYNRTTFKKSYRTDRLSLNKNEIIIIVKGLDNKEEALNYFNKIIVSDKAYKGLEKIPYKNFLISVSNFDTMKKEELIDEYLSFYKKYYYQKKAPAIKQEGELINNDGENQNFEIDSKDNHRFVLLIPSRKLNVLKLRNDVFNHDKDFSVTKEKYDETHQMVIVSNLGTKNSAMDYFNKITKDKKVFDQLAKVDYESFVIGDKNFMKFFEYRSLDKYLSFFSDNYIKSIDKKSEEDVFDDNGPYQYDANVAHDFVLIFKKEGINAKDVMNGIKRYNTKTLKTELIPLDDEHNMIVVSNMRNKKQAMMYFRAIISNRNLFSKVEKSGYRNFIISKDNFEIFKMLTNSDDYLKFFSKRYLN